MINLLKLPIFFQLCWLVLVVESNSSEPSGYCATVEYEECRGNGSLSKADMCSVTPIILDDSSKRESKIQAQEFPKGSLLINVKSSKGCKVTLCDSENLMGYCVYSRLDKEDIGEYTKILQSGLSTALCTCEEGKYKIGEDKHFRRNYVGVVYSPYDKYWERGPNSTVRRVSWQNYSVDEIKATLRQISEKFSYVSTFGMGTAATASNDSKWQDGDRITFVAPLAADLNNELGYPALRISLGIFRKDDANLKWNSKELFNAIDVARYSNEKFNGTVWGITVTSEYVKDSVKAKEALDMIKTVKEINERERLKLKVGIRLGKCDEFIANKRPEDDTDNPAYQQATTRDPSPVTTFQAGLHEIAKISDYILCISFPPSNYAQLPMPKVLGIMQRRFVQLREALREINPRLRLVIETGIPSHGFGNGFANTLENLQLFWHSMADFAYNQKLMFHMFEAVDQPWKNVEDAVDRFDINGPNGTDAHYGWWRRVNNSFPPIYIEKILEGEVTSLDGENQGENWFEKMELSTKILLLGFCGFVTLTLVAVGLLGWKLRSARRDVIGRAYINQFHSGGSECNTDDTNYAVALRIPYDRKYELSKDSFEMDKGAVIGSGQCGVVLRGTVKGQPVAFKCTTATSTVVDIKAIMSEIKILCYIGNHENLVCILGAYTKKIQRGIVYIALEYCPLGSLETFLRKLDDKNCGINSNNLTDDEESEPSMRYVTMADGYLSMTNPCYTSAYTLQQESFPYSKDDLEAGYVTASQIDSIEPSQPNKSSQSIVQVDFTGFLRWSYQIASAMEYVSQKNVIHADLAARNILLASIDHVKVSDFGLSRKLYQEMGVMHDKDTPLPFRWMAPESLKHLVFSVESDVWAFGVTIWEIFSMAEVPYHGISYDMQFVGQLAKGMRLPQAKYASAQIHDQLMKCWNEVPSSRPSFSELKQLFLKLSISNPQDNGI